MREAHAIHDIRFDNPRLDRVGVDILSFEDLRSRAGIALAAPQRVDFHLLLFVETGSGQHMVDFVKHELLPGRVILVRAGQIQQWHMHENLRGRIVLISTQALAPSVAPAGMDMRLLSLESWSTAGTSDAMRFEDVLGDVRRLQNDIDRFAGSDIETAIISHLLLALLLRLARILQATAAEHPESREREIYGLLMREMEASFHERPSTLDFARRLGYSESTLSRACMAVAGYSAKALLDRRIALEAKRMLIHSPASTSEIGYRLGFTETTNFVKFFRRMEGVTPRRFRAAGA
ncbi:MAG TPA: helix-turn-helix domain-containing protein [Paraburkholderia sp.]|uniref:AraC family transcriptional regulator n=1 Tax=Paraburkholderia sp. TaxID=1926495 RepID=UPI002B467393|nr:helix-turn-helix domain-containing protein [Paraburkholderia sp.]HKR41064.1 helix-turn-helix domain-containing protein [Paraburkholderia sp.]